MRFGWLWTLFVAFELTHSLYQLWKTACERDTSDDELLVAFEGKQNPWSLKHLCGKLMLVLFVYLPLQLRIGQGIDGWRLEPVSKPVCRAFKRVAAGWSFSTTV